MKTAQFVAPTRYVSAGDYLKIVNVFRSILAWRGHTAAMAKSAHHAAAMLGEIDDPSEPSDEDAYNPLRSAGYFGIMHCVETLQQARNQFDNRTFERASPSNSAIKMATPCAIQLLYALLDDEDALTITVRWMRTGYIGGATSEDKQHVPALLTYLRKIARFSGSFEERAAAGDWESPLKLNGKKLPVEHIVELEHCE